MRLFIQTFANIALPFLVFLTLSTLIWQKIDDFNSEISRKFVRLEMIANNEKFDGISCSFGLKTLNSNVQSVSILFLLVAFLSCLTRKKLIKVSIYLPVILTISLVSIFNIFTAFFRFDLNFPKEIGFYSRYTTLPDLFLSLFFALLVITLIPNLYYLIKERFQAKLRLR
jgi:hypothetical protein